MGAPKERLQSLLTELRARASADSAALARDVEDKGEDTTPSQHPADVASDLYAREELLTERLALAAEIEEVETALHRLAMGTYGLCIDCGASIDQARLDARPQAARCITCQRRLEERRARSRVRA
ncbi:MAG TPA: TraR/DksA C4-type zinc finger protein [Candidatus Limnocylindria bacterium]|nr:TraR/DksA C4-type zinc finger protein [Candidatus Limnocylindria bacterium]